MSAIRLVRLFAFPRSIPYATPFDTVARLRIVGRKDVGRDQSNPIKPVPRGHEDKMLGDSKLLELVIAFIERTGSTSVCTYRTFRV